MAFAGVTNIAGLLALLSLIPFIILYLRRPKPKDETVPSLMFLMQENKRSKQHSFLQRFTSNLLFYLQLLVLLLLSLAIASPFVNLPYDITRENTVIIIDASASMQAREGGESRFDRALDGARGALSGRNTIILAETTPVTVLEDGSSDLARDVLGKLKPRATSTNLGDALLLAKDILGGKPGRIVIISDFLMTEGPDVQVIRTLLTAEDKVVDFIDVSSKVQNTGIIRLEVGKFASKVYVRNFDNEERKRTIEIKKDGKAIASSNLITIAPNSIENFEFDTPAGISTVELSPKDSFEVDDIAYLATPDKLKTNVLLITNLEDKDGLNNLELALRASPDIALRVVHPPVLTITDAGEKIDPYKQDLIIFYRVTRESILPGTFKEVKGYVGSGGSLIYAAQSDLDKVDLGDLALVRLKGQSDTLSKICVDTINSVTQNFERESCFTVASQHLAAEAGDKTVVFASANGDPVIAYRDVEGGNVAYYGIMDETSDFRNLPSYPIFWNSLINFMVGTEDIKSYNYNTGSIATFEEQDVKTPSAAVRASKLLLDEQGIYEFSGRKVAANLLNEKESAVSAEGGRTDISGREALLTGGEPRHDFNLVFLFSFIALVLVFIELLFVKVRGDV